MWNRPTGPNAAAPMSIWTPEQLIRLEYEWNRIQRSYAYHPSVRVQPIEGDPPTEYQVEYQVRTLVIDDAGQLTYAASCAVRVRLGPNFPNEEPIVRPLSAVFHPNAATEQLQIMPPWQPTNTLVDVVERIGALLAFHAYDAQAAWNPVALQWVTQNADYLPTDPEVNFAPEAGGHPLDRLCRSGEATLAQMKQGLQQKCAAILEAKDPPSFAEIRSYAQQTRTSLSLFTAQDVPSSLSDVATVLDQWATDLPQAATVLDALRKMRGVTAAGLTAATELDEAQRALASLVREMESMVTTALARGPLELLQQLPPLTDLQKIHAQLRAQLAKTDQKLGIAKQRLPGLIMPTRSGETFCAPLQKTIEIEVTRQTSAVAGARERLSWNVSETEPLVGRAKLEVAALEKLLGWREYADLRAKATDLVERVKEWGSAGIQAYFVFNEGGEYGPFEFEQNLELGAAPLVVRNAGRTGLEAVDVKSGLRMGRSDSGELRVSVAGNEPGESFPTTFRMTARCDELALQFDYLARQTQTLLSQLAGAPPATPSWGGRALSTLATPEARAALKADHDAVTATLKATASDLAALAPYKERLATYFLLDRFSEAIPRWQKERAETHVALTRANTRLGEILGRSGKDLENDRPIIPAKLHKEYQEATLKHDQAQRDLMRLEKLQEISANQVRVRTESRSLLGKAQVPIPRVLEPLPDGLTELAGAISNEAIEASVESLGKLLGVEFALTKARKAKEAKDAEATKPAKPDAAAPPPAAPAAAAPAAAAPGPVARPPAAPEARRPEAPKRKPAAPVAPAPPPPPPPTAEEIEVEAHPEEQFAVEEVEEIPQEAHAGDGSEVFAVEEEFAAEEVEESSEQSDNIFGDWPPK